MNFGFLCGHSFGHCARQRLAGFRRELGGRKISVLDVSDLRFRDWDASAARMRRWVRRLPKPCAVMADADDVASELVCWILDAGNQNQSRIVLSPREVCVRQSTDMLAIPDPIAAAALRFIRENAHRPITPRDVVAAVPASRRSLEVRFKSATERSIQDEIWRSHIERATRLLAKSSLTMEEISPRCGFTSARMFSEKFANAIGCPPSRYRAQARYS